MVKFLSCPWMIAIMFRIFLLGNISQEEISFPLQVDRLRNIDEKMLPALKGSESTLVIFAFDPEQTFHKRISLYLEAIASQYRGKGLVVYGVSLRGLEATKTFRSLSVITYPLIAESVETILAHFNWKSCCGGLAVLKGGRVMFSSESLVEEETIRQLIEKTLFGKIQYSVPVIPAHSREILTEKIKSLQFRKAYTNDRFSFNEIHNSETLVLTLMSTLCSVCQSGKRIAHLKTLREREGGEKERVSFALVFSDPFDEHDLESMTSGLSIPFPVYFAKNIFSREEILITTPGAKSDPLTIIFNEDGRILFREKPGMSEEDVGENVKKYTGYRKRQQ